MVPFVQHPPLRHQRISHSSAREVPQLTKIVASHLGLPFVQSSAQDTSPSPSFLQLLRIKHVPPPPSPRVQQIIMSQKKYGPNG